MTAKGESCMIAIFLAEGFEEIEALAPADCLRRAGKEVKLVGVTGKQVRGSHQIGVVCDVLLAEFSSQDLEQLEMVVLPGGMPGTLNLEKSSELQRILDYAAEKSLWICAICAAPSILGHKGLLREKHAVCYPGFEQELTGAVAEQIPVCQDGNIITSRGPGTALAFGSRLVEVLCGRETAENLRKSMQCSE